MKVLGLERQQWRIGELYFWLVALFAFFVTTIFFVTLQDWRMVIPITAALGGVTLAWFGGTRVCMPIYFATTFGNQFTIAGLPVSINQGMAVLVFVSFFIDLLRYRVKWNISWAFIFFMVFQVTYLTATLLKRPEGAEFPIQPPFYILLTLMVMLLYWEEKWLKWLLLVFALVSTAIVILPGAYEAATGNDLMQAGYYGLTGRINGIAQNSILYAFTAIWALPLVALFFVESKDLYTRTFWFCSGLGITALIFLTLNRQSPVILAGVVFTFVLFSRYRHKWALMGVFLAVGILLGQVFLVKAADRIESARKFTKDPSLTMRRDKVVIALHMLEMYPFFGVGHNHFRYMWWDNRPRGETFMIQYQYEQHMYVDMGYVQILVEYGLVGSGLFLLTILSAFVLWLKHYRLSWGLKETWYANLMAAIAAMFAQLLISLLIQDTWVIPRTFFLFGILFAACGVVQHAVNSNNDQQIKTNDRTLDV